MIRELFELLGYVLFRLVPNFFVHLFKRFFICSHKKHDFVWSGGTFIFHDKYNLRCKRCNKGIHKNLKELEKMSREEGIKIH